MKIDKKSRGDLKNFFARNSIPTESNFRDLIDAPLNQKDDGIAKAPLGALNLEVAADAERTAINFYESFAADKLSWVLSLFPGAADLKNARRGFGIRHGSGALRLFIDEQSGNVGIGTASPAAPLEVSGAALVQALTVLGAANLQGGLAVSGASTLSGDLIASGKVGIGTASPQKPLDVAGEARVQGGLTVDGVADLGRIHARATSFKVGGEQSRYYPVIFDDQGWDHGPCTIEICRSDVHLDGNWNGSMLARFTFHSSSNGHRCAFDEVTVRQMEETASPEPRYVARYARVDYSRELVIWLRGDTSYFWRSNQKAAIVYLEAAETSRPGMALPVLSRVDPDLNVRSYSIGREQMIEVMRSAVRITGPTDVLSHISIRGNGTIGGDLAVSGNSTLTGDLGVLGKSAMAGDLSVGGKSTLTGEVTVGGNAALTGNLDVKGKVVIGAQASERALDVGGDTRVLGSLHLAARAMKLDGDADKFYPVRFRDDGWLDGPCTLELSRSQLHTDGDRAGSLSARFVFHGNNFDHRSDFDELAVHQTSVFIARWRRLRRTTDLVLWLRGSRTYWYRSSNPITVTPSYQAVTYAEEDLPILTAPDKECDLLEYAQSRSMQRHTVRGALHAAGSVGIGTASPEKPLDVIGEAQTRGLTVNGASSFNGTTSFSGPTTYNNQASFSGLLTCSGAASFDDGVKITGSGAVTRSDSIGSEGRPFLLHVRGPKAVPIPGFAGGNVDRVGVAVSGEYPELTLFTTAKADYGATIRLGSLNCENSEGKSNVTRHWSIGIPANGARRLDFGVSNPNEPNAHAGINDLAGTTVLSLTKDGRVGIRNLNPQKTLDVKGDAQITGALNVTGKAEVAGLMVTGLAEMKGGLSFDKLGIGLGAEKPTKALEVKGDTQVQALVVTGVADLQGGIKIDKLGIGVERPTKALEVDGDAQVKGLVVTGVADLQGGLKFDKLGIGIEAPSKALEVEGDALISGLLDIEGGLTVANTISVLPKTLTVPSAGGHFVPVFFKQKSSGSFGACTLELSEEESSGAQVQLFARFTFRASATGGILFDEYIVNQELGYLGDYRKVDACGGIILWLRSGKTYSYRSTHELQVIVWNGSPDIWSGLPELASYLGTTSTGHAKFVNQSQLSRCRIGARELELQGSFNVNADKPHSVWDQVQGISIRGAESECASPYLSSNVPAGDRPKLFIHGQHPELILQSGRVNRGCPSISLGAFDGSDQCNRWTIGIGNTENAPLEFGLERTQSAWSLVAQINQAGQWESQSDQRLKESVEDMHATLDQVMQLKPVRFTWKSNQRRDIGFIAQQVEPLFPELVGSMTQTSEDGESRSLKTLSYTGFGPIAIAAVQELAQRVSRLAAENEDLKARIEKIEKERR